MRRHLRNLAHRGIIRRALVAIGAAYARFVHATTRWQVVGAEAPRRMIAEGGVVIGSFWHGRLMLMPFIWPPGRPFYVLSSKHRDGRLIADVIARLGITTIDGSSSKDGAQALRAMVKALRAGNCVGMTPDGPRGPLMQAAPGVGALARLSGAPVVPVAYSVSRRLLLDSWDRFIVPLPFGRGVFFWGEPLVIPRDADDEAATRLIAAAMTAAADQADDLAGVPRIRPADAGVPR